MFAVALDLGRGAVAKRVLEFDIHVVFFAFVGDGCSAFDLLFLGGGHIEEVMSTLRRGELTRGVSGIHL